ncbi:hypothetical protein K1X76_04650 [bacterium]|nr:hypothetical protein [bacterium]
MRVFLILLICLVLVKPVWADEAKRWEAGVFTGFGGGAVTALEDIFDTEDARLGYLFNNLNGYIAHYFSPYFGLRLSAGVDLYHSLDLDYSFFMPSGDLDAMIHFTKSPTQFDPYVLVGGGFPRIVHAGFGNRFTVGKNIHPFVEVVGSTFLTWDYRGEVRAGVGFSF